MGRKVRQKSSAVYDVFSVHFKEIKLAAHNPDPTKTDRKGRWTWRKERICKLIYPMQMRARIDNFKSAKTWFFSVGLEIIAYYLLLIK